MNIKNILQKLLQVLLFLTFAHFTAYAIVIIPAGSTVTDPVAQGYTLCTPGNCALATSSASSSGIQNTQTVNFGDITSTGTVSTVNLTGTNGTLTNSTSTNLFASLLNALTAVFTNLSATNATLTNATTTNFFTSTFNALTSAFTNLSATNATFTNATTTNISITNGLGVTSGGTGTTTTPTYGQMLVGNSSGGYDFIATSSFSVATATFAQSTTLGASVTNATATGIFFLGADGKLSQDTANFNYDATTKKLTVTGGIDPLYFQAKDVLTSGQNTAYYEAYSGDAAGLSVANTGRLRYATGTQSWQVSTNGGPYQDILVSGGNISWANATGTNATITNIYSGGSFSLTNGTIVGATIANATITNATTTNFFASILNAVSGIISTLTAGLINVGTLNATSSINSLAVNASTTNASTTLTDSLVAVNATLTNATATIISATNGTISGIFNAATATIATSTITRLNVLGNTFLGTVASGTASDTIVIVRDQTTGELKQATLAALTSTTTGSISFSTTTGILTYSLNGVPSTTTLDNFAQLTVGNATFTNATTTNFFASLINVVSGIISTLTAGIINVGTINATSSINSLVVNASTTNASTSNFVTANGTTVNSQNVFASTTNASTTNTETLNSLVGNITTLNTNSLTATTSASLASTTLNGNTIAGNINATGTLSVTGTTTISTTTIASATIGIANISNLNISGVSLADATITNATTTNLVATLFNAVTAYITTLWGTTGNFATLNASTTNASTTNTQTLAVIGTSTFATTTQASSTLTTANITNANISNLNISGLSVPVATISNATTSNLATDNIIATGTSNLTNVVSTNATLTNSTSTNFAVSGNTQINTLSATGDVTLSGTNTFATTTISTSSITNLNVLSTLWANLLTVLGITATNATFTNSTTTNLFATTASATNVFVGATTTSGALRLSDRNNNSIPWDIYEAVAGGLIFDYAGAQAGKLSASGIFTALLGLVSPNATITNATSSIIATTNITATGTATLATANITNANITNATITNATSTGAHHHAAPITVGTFNSLNRQIISANGQVTAAQFDIVSGDGTNFNFDLDLDGSADSPDPTIVLVKGQTYKFNINASGHPFEIRTSAGGAAYNTGVTNNSTQSGIITFTVPVDAPDTLVYECVNHPGSMLGQIKIVGSSLTGTQGYSITFDANGNQVATSSLSYDAAGNISVANNLTVSGSATLATGTVATLTSATSSITNLNVLSTLWANILSILNLNATNATITNSTSTNLFASTVNTTQVTIGTSTAKQVVGSSTSQGFSAGISTNKLTIEGGLAQTVGTSSLAYIAETRGTTPGTTLFGAAKLFVSGNYAYIPNINRDSLAIIDISNPANPTFISETQGPTPGTSLDGAYAVYVSGNYAYVANSSRNSLAVIDVSNPASPVFVSETRGPTPGTTLSIATSVFVSGKYAYVTSSGNDSLVVIDISNPLSPTYVGQTQGTTPGTTLDSAADVVVSGNYAYVANQTRDSLAVIDISNPTAPTFVAETRGTTPGTTLDNATGVAVSGRYAYVANQNRDSLAVIDISNPASPTFIGETQGATPGTTLDGAFSVSVSGNYVYVLTGGNASIVAIDVSNPYSPVVVSENRGPTPGTSLQLARGLFVSGKYAYATSYTRGSLVVFDIGGSDIASANIGSVESDSINVNGLLQSAIAFIRTSLNVGNGGILSNGNIAIGSVASSGQSIAGVLQLASATSTSLVSTTSNALYNNNGTLYWNGTVLGGGSGSFSGTSSLIMFGGSQGSILTAVTGSSTGYTNFSGGIGTGANGFAVGTERLTSNGNLINIGSIQAGETKLTSAGTFASKVDYVTSSQARTVSLGDVNGDGKLDALVVTQSGLSLHMNQGNGTFGTGITFGTGGMTAAIVDVNGDSKVDIVVANFIGSRATVHLNNGNGTFATGVDYVVGTNPYGVVVSDVNSDGKLDIVTVNQTAGNISVLMGAGDGTFGAATNYTAGSAPTGITVGDFSGDGKADIAVTNFTGANMSVFINNGNGTFATKVDYTTGTNPIGIATADVNSDGVTDLIVGNSGSSNASVFINNGNGTFATKVDYTIGSGVYTVALGDVSGDGKMDLATANGIDGTVSVLFGNGTGGFGTKTDYVASSTTRGVALGDINGDGKLDMVASNFGAAVMNVFVNNPSTMFYAQASSGGVGIGTTTNIFGGNLTSGLTLNNALVIASSTNISTTTFALYNNNGTLYWNGSALGGSSLPASTTSLYVAANGNVGVGTSTPDSSFVVVGTSTFSTTTAASSSVGSLNITSSLFAFSGTISNTFAKLFATTYEPGTIGTIYADNLSAASTTSRLRISATSTSFLGITGIVAGSDGQELTIVNASSTQSFTIYNQSASSTAANRVITGTGADLTVGADASINLVYDSTSLRWRVVGGSGGSSGTTVSSTNLTNFTASSTVGTAVATVDTYTNLNIAQASSSVVLTLPSPTVTTAGKTITVNNTGTAAFTMHDVQVPSNGSSIFVWNGSFWSSVEGKGNVASEYGFDSLTATEAVSVTGSGVFADLPNLIFAIPSAGTWEIGYDVTGQMNAAGSLKIAIFDNSNVMVTGSLAGHGNLPSGERTTFSKRVFVTTTGAETYKLRVASSAGATTIQILGVSTSQISSITWQKISGNAAITGQTVDYVNVVRNATGYTTTAGGAYLFDTTQTGNIPYNSGTGQFTLSAGKTYRLESGIQLNVGTNAITYQWYNVTAGASIGSPAISFSTNAGSPVSDQQNAVAIITPSVNTVVELRTVEARNTNSTANMSYAVITQLGSSAITSDTILANGGNTGTSTIFGTLGNYFASIITNGVEYMRFLATGQGLIGTTTINTTVGTSTLSIVGTTSNGTVNVFSVASSTGSSLFLVQNDGNVGIGNANPATARLDITSSQTGSPALILRNGSGANVFEMRAGTSTSNISIGVNALRLNNNGFDNTAVGSYALEANVDGNYNTAYGKNTLILNANGSGNTALGNIALAGLTSGSYVTAIGDSAGRYIADGNDNASSSLSVFLGYNTRASATGNQNEIVIGANAVGNGSNTLTLGSTSLVSTIFNSQKVGVGTTTPGATFAVAGSALVTGTSTFATTTVASSSITNLNVLSTLWANIISVLNFTATNATITNATSSNFATGNLTATGSVIVSGTTSLATTTLSGPLSVTSSTTLASTTISSLNLASLAYNSTVSGTTTTVGSTDGSGVTAALSLAVDSSGNVWTSHHTGTIVGGIKLAPDGATTTYVTGGGTEFIAADHAGNVYLSRTSPPQAIVKIDTLGATSTFATIAGSPQGIFVDKNNNLYVASFGNSTVVKLNSSGTTLATYSLPVSTGPINVVVDAQGNMYTANLLTDSVSKITPAGATSTLMSGLIDPRDLVINSQGIVYVPNASGGLLNVINTNTGATSTISMGASMERLAIDGNDNMYIEVGTTLVRMTSSGATSTVATGIDIKDITVDTNNNVYFVDSNNIVRKYTPGYTDTRFLTLNASGTVALGGSVATVGTSTTLNSTLYWGGEGWVSNSNFTVNSSGDILALGNATFATTTISTSSITNLNVLGTLWANLLSVLNLNATNATITNATSSNIVTTNLTATGTAYFAGNVGIGTTTANTYKLELQSTNDFAFRTHSPADSQWVMNANGGQNVLSARSGGNNLYLNNPSGILYLGATTTGLAGNLSANMSLLTNGRVGIGTTSPLTTLDVGGTASADAISIHGSGSNNALIFNDDGNIGFHTDSSNLYIGANNGNIFFRPQGRANSSVQPSVTSTGGLDGFTNIVVSSSTLSSTFAGNVGIGTTTPDQTLSLNANNAGISLRDSVTGAMGWMTRFTNRLQISATEEVNIGIGAQATSHYFFNTFAVAPTNDNSSSLGLIGNRWTEVFATNGTINTSDARLKENILDLTDKDGLEAVLALRPVTYNWIDKKSGTQTNFGFLAQEVYNINPELVVGTTTGSSTLGINYSNFIPLLTKAVQQLNSKVFGGSEQQAISIDELTASSTISVDTKLKALGTNMKEVNDFLKDIKEVTATSSLGTTTTNTVVDTQVGTVACDANAVVGGNLNSGIITNISTSSSGIEVNGFVGVNYNCEVTTTSTTTTTTTDLTFVGKIIERVKTWLADATNGIAKIFVGEVETKKLCVANDVGEKTCLTKEQIDQLLLNSVNANSNTNVNSNSTDSDDSNLEDAGNVENTDISNGSNDSTPPETPAPEPTPAPVTEPAPTE